MHNIVVVDGECCTDTEHLINILYLRYACLFMHLHLIEEGPIHVSNFS